MRAFFFRRTWRERILLLLILAVAVVAWLFSAMGRARGLHNRWAAAAREFDDQASWLADRPAIERRLADRLAHIQQGRSLNSNQFFSQINDLVSKHGFGGSKVDTPSSERKPPVMIHTLALSLSRVADKSFYDFVDDLGTTLPLVNIEQVKITPDRRSPGQLDVALKLSALELLH